jgi:hypothetical protein
MSYFEKTQILAADSPSIDAFARWRVSNPKTQFDSKLIFSGSLSNYWATRTWGNATSSFTPYDSKTILYVGTESGSRVVEQTKQQFVYEPGKCVGQSEYIILADGTRKQAKDLVNTSFELLTNVSGAVIKTKARAELNAYEDVFKLTTKSGNQIVRNSKHPLWVAKKTYKHGKKAGSKPTLTSKGWIDFQDIQVGDCVAITNKLNVFGQSTALTDTDAKILGYLIGDGGMSTTLTFTQQNNIQLDEFSNLADEYDCVLNPTKSNKMTYNIVCKNITHKKDSNKLINLVRKVGLWGHTCHSKFVPNEIFESPKKIIAAFLSRLYSTDGWACDKEIGYCSTSERLILDIKSLLLKFGIRGHVAVKNMKNPNHATAYNLFLYSKQDIDVFASEIGIFGKEKAVSNVVDSVKDSFPQKKHLFQYKDIPDGLHWEEIKSIECIGKDWTVAIETDTHTYLTSFYEHNSLLIVMTGLFCDCNEGIEKYMIYGNDTHGLGFCASGSSFGVIKRDRLNESTITTTFISQSEWNLDRFDGTGPSGKTHNEEYAQIYFVDMEWLGVGRVRYGIFQGGIPYYVHQLHHINELTTTYMGSPNLPVRYEIVNKLGSAATSSMRHICCSVVSEGGSDSLGIIRAVDMAATPFTIEGNDHCAVLAIRHTTGSNFDAYRGNASQIRPLGASVMPTGNTPTRWAILLNPTIPTSASFAWIPVGGFGAEYAVGAAAREITEEGSILASGYIPAGTNQVKSAENINLDPFFAIGEDLFGNRDVIVLAVWNLSGTSTPIYASMNYRETI